MKIRRYEVLESMGCYVIREKGIRGETGLIGRTFERSKLEKDAATRLVEQANHAAELLELLAAQLIAWADKEFANAVEQGADFEADESANGND